MSLYPLAIITLGIMGSLVAYLRRVPEAGPCPRCGGGAHATDAGGVMDRWAPVRACVDCGWHGRMRGRHDVKTATERERGRMAA